MTPDVSTNFKDDVGDCPCGCGAFGKLNPHTGHAVTCHDACAVCANPRSKTRSRFNRPRRVPPAVRRQVAARARGLCEARCAEDCMNGGTSAHHRRRRSQGGTDTVSNLLWVCEPCHRWIHDHITEAVERGFLTHTEAP